MGWIYRDYTCEACLADWTDMVDNRGDQRSPCPSCGTMTQYGISAPHVASFSIKDPADRAASLKKRSLDHSAQMLKKDGPPTPRRKKK